MRDIGPPCVSCSSVLELAAFCLRSKWFGSVFCACMSRHRRPRSPSCSLWFSLALGLAASPPAQSTDCFIAFVCCSPFCCCWREYQCSCHICFFLENSFGLQWECLTFDGGRSGCLLWL